MRRFRSIAAGIALAAVACGAPGAPQFFLGGIMVNEPDHEVWFEALKRAGMNTVAVTVYAKQGDWDSADLWWEEQEPAVLAEIRGAREAGLSVVLILRVALDHAFERNRFLWHGMIAPSGEAALDEWFRRYREFAVKWAAIAEAEGVDILGVASEMSHLTSTLPVDAVPPLEAYYLAAGKLEQRRDLLLAERERIGRDGLERELDAEIAAQRAWARSIVGEGDEAAAVARINARRERMRAHWRAVIAAVRERYSGPLTYAANFDQYEEVELWSLLDAIGINAYFELTTLGRVEDLNVLEPQMQERWAQILDEIDAFRVTRGIPDHPVLFTEIGYTTRRRSTLAPWAGAGFAVAYADDETEVFVWDEEPEGVAERAAAIRALHHAAGRRERPLLKGLLYWKLSTVEDHRRIEPFVHILDDPDDPLGEALRRFAP